MSSARPNTAPDRLSPTTRSASTGKLKAAEKSQERTQYPGLTALIQSTIASGPIEFGNRDPLLAQTVAEEFVEQALTHTGESEKKLKEFLRVVFPRWCAVSPSPPGRKPVAVGQSRRDIDKVMAKLKDIGITSIADLITRIETNAINRDLASAGHTCFKEETLDEIRRRRPFLNALDVMKVPYCRQMGTLAPVSTMLEKRVRHNHGREDAVVVPMSVQKVMRSPRKEQQQQQHLHHHQQSTLSLGSPMESRSSSLPARPNTSPERRNRPPPRNITPTRASSMAAVVKPAQRPEPEGLATTAAERPFLRLSSKRAKPGHGSPVERDSSAVPLMPARSDGAPSRPGTAPSEPNFNTSAMRTGSVSQLGSRHGMRRSSKQHTSAPSLGTPAQADKERLAVGLEPRQPSSPTGSSATEEDSAFSGLEASDTAEETSVPSKKSTKPTTPGPARAAGWDSHSSARERSDSHASVFQRSMSGKLGDSSFISGFEPTLDEQAERYEQAVAAMPSDPRLPLWAGINSETVMYHVDAFLREQQAFDEKRALMKKIAREGPASATRTVIAKNVEMRLLQEKERETRVRQDMHKRSVSIKNCLGSMQHSRRELNNVRKKYESIQNTQRYDFVGSVFRRNSVKPT